MNDRLIRRPDEVLDPDHPVVQWVRREVLPPLVEAVAPEQVVVFDPPDRPAAAGEHPPGLLVVAARFRGMAPAERMVFLRERLAASSPVRPLCLTPEEYRLARGAPGPVLGAVRTGVSLV
jgi:hypothetical protein